MIRFVSDTQLAPPTNITVHFSPINTTIMSIQMQNYTVANERMVPPHSIRHFC